MPPTYQYLFIKVTMFYLDSDCVQVLEFERFLFVVQTMIDDFFSLFIQYCATFESHGID